ncbi:hypothetical protein HCG60_03870 [Ligilactobacillus murinus]|uniref:hypothetical protein n=1 Tax=Ligilactobacillus murinus TaxID=1622 RepID=UPI001C8BA0B5|nr:hypothetical protein [Ligilactobacillus murinus]MBX9012168.1 hypothetical protein [Ligilactobacillus murinus]
MKKYLEIVEKAVVALVFAFIFAGIIQLLGIDFNTKTYICIVIGTMFGWSLIDIIRIKRSR